MRVLIVAGAVACLALGGRAQAEPLVYTWSGSGGFGTKSVTTKCGSYKMTIDVTVDGTSVKGRFQQEQRDERKFDATLGKDGTFKTTAMVGNGGIMDIAGIIKDGESMVVLDGYCRFDAKLTKK